MQGVFLDFLRDPDGNPVPVRILEKLKVSQRTSTWSPTKIVSKLAEIVRYRSVSCWYRFDKRFGIRFDKTSWNQIRTNVGTPKYGTDKSRTKLLQ